MNVKVEEIKQKRGSGGTKKISGNQTPRERRGEARTVEVTDF